MILLTAHALTATRAAFAQDAFASVLSQYTASWSSSPGFQLTGHIWDPDANFQVVFEALPSSLTAAITSSNTANSFAFYQSNFQGVLASWSLTELTNNVQGPALVADTVAFLNQIYSNVAPKIAQMYPGYPDDVYKGLVIMNLVHGYHIFGSSIYYEEITNQRVGYTTAPILITGQLTLADELDSLLQASVADCGATSEFVRVLGKIWGLDMRYLGLWTDYDSPLANAEVASTHAINILVYTANASGAKAGLILDALTNLAIAPGPVGALLPNDMVGDGILSSASTPTGRYAALSSAGKILRFFDYYMHPPVRAGYLKTGQPDASTVSFMYVYYLEAYPNAAQPMHGAQGWLINNAAYSLKQPLD